MRRSCGLSSIHGLSVLGLVHRVHGMVLDQAALKVQTEVGPAGKINKVHYFDVAQAQVCR